MPFAMLLCRQRPPVGVEKKSLRRLWNLWLPIITSYRCLQTGMSTAILLFSESGSQFSSVLVELRFEIEKRATASIHGEWHDACWWDTIQRPSRFTSPSV